TCKKLVVELGVGTADDVVSVQQLTGGVASDIAMVDLGDRRICVKFALEKLKVAEDWHAPVHRNKAEYYWLQVAASVSPETAVKLYGRSETANGFAMEFLDGKDVYLWKDALLDTAPDKGEASTVGEVLGKIHAVSALANFDSSPFQNRDDFRALRLEPYLNFTATRHPNLAKQLNGLADNLYDANDVLIHGDVSPKNILFRSGRPIILDAECATMGDASFDVAFCLNHLVLKAVHMPASRKALLAAVTDFWKSYKLHVDWENIGKLEARICALLPALMLARIDGKSPVEYLSDANQHKVRDFAVRLIVNPVPNLASFLDILALNLKENQ
ncbi:MAG: aminoglycoside phosphotransferase family protein, partial [Rhizobiales bacterium]|nr:aminoglycoside phosphotransferase family protein [Hyphomicrobiales bacterium]